MSFIAAAAIAAGGALLGGVISSGAASSAANAQTNAANQANATNMAQWQQMQSMNAPWVQNGTNANNMLSYLMGVNGGTAPSGSANLGAYGSLATPFSQTNWQTDPGYAFRLAEGQKALERSGAARGMTLSGAQAKALDAYGQGQASQEYGNAYNRYQTDQNSLYNKLSGLSGAGQASANMTAQSSNNMVNNNSANLANAANASAAGTVGSTNAVVNGINSGINSWQNGNMWNSLMNQGAADPYTGTTQTANTDWSFL